MAYEALAPAYDSLTRDIPYGEIFTFWQRILARHDRHPETVLDLACGTGSFTVLLAEAGYEVTGCDISEEMLTAAAAKTVRADHPPFYIRQSMTELSLPRQVDWIVSCLDGFNYLTAPELCRRALERCFAALKPGGCISFDVSSARKLRDMDGQVWLDENEDAYCVWRTEFSPEERICYFGVDLFRRCGTLWRRSFEEHRQYAYTPEELSGLMEAAGFRNVEVFADLTPCPPTEESQRIFVYGEKEGQDGRN